MNVVAEQPECEGAEPKLQGRVFGEGGKEGVGEARTPVVTKSLGEIPGNTGIQKAVEENAFR